MSYQPTPQVIVGGEKKTKVRDAILEDLTLSLLVQVKIMNAYLALIAGEELDETDISERMN